MWPARSSWYPLGPGTLKRNIDASFQELTSMGIGMCIRDERGAFVKARTITFSPKLQVHEGEALGLLEALQWVKDLGSIT